jgi:tetratricopeptide (TPR) repeat protein
MVAAAAVLLGGAAAASERSEILYSRGLVDFHAGNYEKALEIFNQAVAADSTDAYALYYRGVTRGRLNDSEGAIADLRAALAQRPGLNEAALELGVVLVDRGRYGEAAPLLEQAQHDEVLDAQASLFLGICQLRQGRPIAAQPNFERAAAKDPRLQTSAHYYLGVAAYQAAQWTDAERYFSSVAAANPDSQMGREAAEFLDAVRSRQARPYHIYASSALEYDSNVSISPANDILAGFGQLAISKRDDERHTFSFGGTYTAWQSDWALFTVGYDFFQSLYFDLTQFNLQDHRPSAQFVARIGNYRFGILGHYDYYRLDYSSFLQEGALSPWLAILDDNFGRLEVFYRIRRRDYLDNRFAVRDALNNSPGIREVIEFGDPLRYFAFGYRFDREDPVHHDDVSQSFGYDGHEVSADAGWDLPAQGLTAQVEYAYHREIYNPESNGRLDSEHEVTAVLYKQLTDYLRLNLAFLATINDSNQRLFQYDRYIGSVGLEVFF